MQNTTKIRSLTANVQALPEGYPISAKVVCDSLTPDYKHRLTTLEVVFPRYVLCELNTHRALSKNTSSSRAIPTKKQIEAALANMVEPVRYGLNKSGMQASEENLTGEALSEAKQIWREMAEFVAIGCHRLSELGLHKQWASRPLEWFTTTKMLLSATAWDNYFLLRDHDEAQDEMIHLAQSVKIAMNQSSPRVLKEGEWHMPYVSEKELEELGLLTSLKVSTSRCARISYKTQHGNTSTAQDDISLFNRLTHGMEFKSEENPFHASPTEHVATPNDWVTDEFEGTNFRGWTQLRRFIEAGKLQFT